MPNQIDASRIAVAITTRRRPVMLGECLLSMLRLKIPDATVSLIVVENDDKNCSADIVDSFRQRTPFPLHYVLETTSGIPFARNRAIEEALNLQADWLVFLDDDETVDPDWLVELLISAKKYQADVVHGRVIYQYPEDDKWAHLSEKNFIYQHRQDGKSVHSAATNNVIISARLFRQDGLELRFDNALKFSGGSDTDFFNRARIKGARLVYGAKAIVYETVPIERCSLAWLFSRDARIAATSVYMDKKNIGREAALFKHMRRFLQNVIQCPGLFVLAMLFVLFDLDRAKKYFLKGYLKIASAYGRYRGLKGRLFTPYKKVDGQ
jgi:succinoglycan biosynthesis protein ExoM